MADISVYDKLNDVEKWFYNLADDLNGNIKSAPREYPKPICIELKKGFIKIQYANGVRIETVVKEAPCNIRIRGCLPFMFILEGSLTMFNNQENINKAINKIYLEDFLNQ